VTFLPVDEAGRIDPGAIAAAITARTFLVSVTHADGRIGTIHPLREIAAVLRGRGILLHADAVQSAGKIPLTVDGLGVDLLSLTGHLLYGPKGTGALYVRRGTPIEPIGFGAGQEGNLRPGTENVPGVVGLGKACEIAGRDLEAQRVHLEHLRGLLAERIRAGIDGLRINGHPTERLPHLLSVSIPGMSGESLVRALDLRGIAVSGGMSVAVRGDEDPPEATGAVGAGGPARGTLLFGLGRNNTPGEMLQTAAVLARLVNGKRLSAQG
jgi:cysteine desulfurase